jgi:hypothetical protein
MKPDVETILRLKSLAFVGKDLIQISNENTDTTTYLIAKQELKKFEDLMATLEIEPDIREGLNSLIKYLDNKLQKRTNQFNKTNYSYDAVPT